MYGRGAHHPVITALLKLLDTTPNELASITIDGAAGALNVSTCHLQHLVKKELGAPFTHIVRRKRVQHASEMLLAKSHLTIEEVAWECGYEALTMYRHFRRELGQSPSDVRRTRSALVAGSDGRVHGVRS